MIYGQQGLAVHELAVEVGHDELLADQHLVEGGQVLEVGALLGGEEALLVLRDDLRADRGVDR